jgi:hypothetical protein
MKTKFLSSMLAGIAFTLSSQSALAGLISFDYEGQIVQYTVNTTGTYEIFAAGASGGKSRYQQGGAGAIKGGSLFLTTGQMLSIAVGGKGINGNHSGGDGNYSGGGGGGSFVTLNSGPTFDSLVIGGGGGGGNYSQDYGVGQDANLGTSGDSGGRCFQDADYSVGGVNGNGGEGANCRKNKSPRRNAAGGGGFFTNGGNGGVGGGQSFLNGLAGGTNYYPNGRGGFGGGGSGYNGGGGGYSGGAGSSRFYGGGGGGSFFSTNVALQPSELTPVGGTGHRGNGYVTLELISDTVPVTEPTTLVILGLGLAGLRLSRRKKT